MNKKLIFSLLVLTLLTLPACAFRHAATAVTADILTRGMIDVEREDDVFVARESAIPLIKVVEVLHNGDPSNKMFLSLMAKVYGNYAFGFAEVEALKGSEEWKQRARRFYLKGRNAGAQALSRGGVSILDMPLPKFNKALKRYGKRDIETLFWTAFDLGSYINMSLDDITIVADLPRVEAMIGRVVDIDPKFECGIAYAFQGALVAGNPLKTGANIELARPLFDKAMSECDSQYLMNKVMYAEWFVSRTKDSKLYKNILDEVISADTTVLPRHRLANELAKERAKVLLGLTKTR